jgi:hypothetical protein
MGEPHTIRPLLVKSPQRTAFISFSILYFLVIFYLFHASARDPTSVFFDPRHGLDPIYTTLRTAQAEEFIKNATELSAPRPKPQKPQLAVGVATVQRPGKRYFRAALGSLLEGLDKSERDAIHLTTFIANVNPEEHQAYREPWLHTLSDEVLTYKYTSPPTQAEMSSLEKTDLEHRVKPMLDYIFLIKACYNTGAPFIAMIEDDVIANDAWYRRLQSALHSLSEEDIASTSYIRLFFNSGLLGWNSERWREHLAFSVFVAVTVFITIRILSHYSDSCSSFLTTRTVLVILFVCTPAIIGLYYAGGRLTVAPLRRGIIRMDTHGCCSQALVFPRYRVPDLIRYWEERGSGFIDSLTEQYSNERDLSRWAIVPSVFQHVGSISTKGDSASDVASRIWNSDFEFYRPAA